MIQKISHSLLRPTEKLYIKFSVGLVNRASNTQNWYNLFETPTGEEYLTINTSANVIIQYKIDAPYDKSHYVHISEKNIMYWNRELERFYTILQNPELFTYYKSGSITYNGTDNDIVSISLLGGEYVVFEPKVILTNSGNSLPGVSMRINVNSNEVELSIDEFESMLYTFRNVHIQQDALQLINIYIQSKKGKQATQQIPPQKINTSVVKPRYGGTESVSGSRLQNVTSLNDL